MVNQIRLYFPSHKARHYFTCLLLTFKVQYPKTSSWSQRPCKGQTKLIKSLLKAWLTATVTFIVTFYALKRTGGGGGEMNEQNWTGFLVKLGRQDPCQQVKHTKLLFWPTKRTPYFHSSGQFDLLQTQQRGLLISTALDTVWPTPDTTKRTPYSHSSGHSLTYSRHSKEDSLFPQLWT